MAKRTEFAVLSKEELSKKRTAALQMSKQHYQMTPDSFTCDSCSYADRCRFVFDLYNTNGDCLREK